jgi:hypothetical protein
MYKGGHYKAVGRGCQFQDQKIAAFGSSNMRLRFSVGAAEGCDLLI